MHSVSKVAGQYSHCALKRYPHGLPTCIIYIVTILGFTIDGVRIGELDLLTTYTYHSELQVITAPMPSKITTAPAKPFPACCVFNSRSLATDTKSGDSSASRAQVLVTAASAELLSTQL
jgi:hypothetical protein